MAATSLAAARIVALPAPAARRGDRRRDRSSRASASRPDDDGAPSSPSPSTPSSSFGVAEPWAPSRRAALLSAASASAVVLPGAPTLAIPSYNVTLAKLDKEARDRHSAQLLAPTPEQAKAATKRIYKGLAAQGEELTQVGGGALSLSPMGIGTWSWGNQFVWGYDESMDPELSSVFNAAVDAGVNLFDTADSYGTGNGLDGRSEVLIGTFLRQCPSTKVDGVNVATKFAAYPWRITRKSVVNAARESCERLGKESVELGQLHWSTGNYQPLQERALWGGIADAYDLGLIKAVGLSNYGPKQLRKIHAYMSERGVPIATLQVQYHLLSRFPELNGTRETCDELGIRTIAYSPLALGLLTGKYSTENPPPGLRGFAYKDVLPPLPGLLDCMRAIGRERGKTLPQIAINWCLCKDTTPIPGVKTMRQLEDNLGALGWRLSEGEVAELDAAAEKVGKSTSQNIFQTA